MTTEEIIAMVRFLMGGLPESVIDDETLTMIINLYVANNPNANDCEIVYNTILNTCQYLMRNAVVIGAVDGGAVTKRREKNSKREVELTYSDGATTINMWKDMYDYFVAHPEDVCKDLLNNKSTVYIVGGIDKDKVNQVRNNPNTVDAGVYVGQFDDIGG